MCNDWHGIGRSANISMILLQWLGGTAWLWGRENRLSSLALH